MANENLNNQQRPKVRRVDGADANRVQRPSASSSRFGANSSSRPTRTQAQTQVPPQTQTSSSANVGGNGSNNGRKNSANHSSKKKTILLVVGIVVVALAIWLLVWLFACNGNSLFDPNAQTGQAPYKSQEEMQAELDRTVEEGMFNISIASVIQFEDGTSSGTAYIENVPGNHYLMKVTITEDDTGDVLYESGVLKPDQYIENIALAKDLDAGAHEATATFTALDEQTYEEVGKAAAKITINVLN
ncbi:hypothetical protein [Adlercreutzia sp. ZJ154]|uniref:hypothetical protein n=1 Tax=Adlercreutzia sp. ZJ154 TaxID=2709790 RepID=UPI0013ED06F0|nr:hypothetical protein [Adlercreutzia sp. ZJ154]